MSKLVIAVVMLVLTGCCEKKHEPPPRGTNAISPEVSMNQDIFEPPYHSTYFNTIVIKGHEYIVADKVHEAVCIIHSASCSAEHR